jgi:hypothetical protein
MTWHPGENWRVVHSLDRLNQQIRAYAPRSVPPATDPNAWGSLADDAHSTSSDHYPHFYAALGSTAVVCARDFPHAPALGLNGSVVTEALRASRDARIGYVIFNRRITGPNHGWRWDPYTEEDPHDTHFHVSTVHTAVADDTRAWALPGGVAATSIGDDMTTVFTSTHPVTGTGAKFIGTVGGVCSWIQNNAWLTGLAVEVEDTPVNHELVHIVGDIPTGWADHALSTGAITIDQATRDALAAAAGQAVKDALGAGGALESRLTAWATSTEGRAALVAAANEAEDS